MKEMKLVEERELLLERALLANLLEIAKVEETVHLLVATRALQTASLMEAEFRLLLLGLFHRELNQICNDFFYKRYPESNHTLWTPG
mmetsp:Transcript_25549/g.51230  ORF Transcript_25549/g.51230 Transcript_25549/m.51230 type:complete len:87 (+) Transcript_25549:619-879(+)